MTERELTISFGEASSLAKITKVESLDWDEFAQRLTAKPPETTDKASVGWYACAEFNPVYRDGENFVVRHCLTLDYDVVTKSDVTAIRAAFEPYAHAVYTTWSHTAEKPRIRVVLPLSRPATMDEFSAVSRKVAAIAGIELAARESHTAAQMTFMPAVKPGAKFSGKVNPGEWIDVDGILGSYEDWTDRNSWPRRAEHDSTHEAVAGVAPRDKPGVVGSFCRAFDIPTAIEKFGLPYERTNSPDRWTLKGGSRAQGVVLYDGNQKAHSHHDTDVARGQTNAFDLTRLHLFGKQDEDTPAETPITERPSFKAMMQFAMQQPELQAAMASEELEDLGPLTEEESQPTGECFIRRIQDVMHIETWPDWFIPDTLERGVIGVMAGRRGSFKSFLATDWAHRVALQGHHVAVVSAEGKDFNRRSKAWFLRHAPERIHEDVPLFLLERRWNLATQAGIDSLCKQFEMVGAEPALIVLDTYSKLTPGVDENDNSEVSRFLGLLDNGLKRRFNATVLIVAHTGHSDAGRPRGASSLSADSDSEWIVTKGADGCTGFYTRERFKESSELSPVGFRTQVMSLGFKDPQGRDVTSLALEETEFVLERKGRRGPVTPAQKNVYDIAQKIAVTEPIYVETLIGAAVANSVKDPVDKKDRRRENAVRTINQLIGNGHLFVHPGGKVGLSNARVVNAEEMNELDGAKA